MYLGIDLGTSGVKVVLIDDDQAVVGSGSAPLEASRPRPGWSEQDPEDWIVATERAIGALRTARAAALAGVRGVGLSGQMHGATLLDEHDAPLRPCMLWNDTRAHREAAELDADPRFRAITGNIVFPGFTAPKVAWVARHEPRVFERTRWVLLPKDYLRLWLTGEHVSDMSDASGTSWLDTGARRWSTELLAATELDERQMPALAEGTAVTGTLRREIAARWGIGGIAVVAGGAGDNAASGCALGVVEAGSAFVSLGTSGVLFAATRAYSPNAGSAVHTFCHALPATWHQMGVILSATDSLNWLATLLGTTPAELTASLGERIAPPGSVTFLPYLGGERTPHNDADGPRIARRHRPRDRSHGVGAGRRRGRRVRALRQPRRAARRRHRDRARLGRRRRNAIALLARGARDRPERARRRARGRRLRRGVRRRAPRR